jgi:hypothetical protein
VVPDQAAEAGEALWVAPRGVGAIEDETVRTVASGLLASRGIDAATDLQVRPRCSTLRVCSRVAEGLERQ